MKALVVYDSVYGNTEKIAKSISEALPKGTRAMRAVDALAVEMNDVDLLIVGSPTLGGRATVPLMSFLDGIPPSVLKGIKVAAFDTRLSMKFARIFGWAADKILAKLTTAGGMQIAPPQGFIVRGRKGPLAEKEEQRAAEWAKGLAASMKDTR